MPEGKTSLVLFINFQFSNYQPLPAGTSAGFTDWVDILEAAVYDHLNFNAGILVAGPLLNAIQAEEYHPALLRLRTLATSGQLGIIASPLDNNLVEISSRTDDFYYQLSNYAALAAMTFGVRAPSWEGIYCPQGRLTEHPLRSMGRVAAELNAQPILVVDLQKDETGDSDKEDSQSRIIIRQEIAEAQFYQVPVHLRYDAAGFTLDEVTDAIKGQGTGAVLVEVRLDFSKGLEGITAGAYCFEALVKQLVADPDIELLGLREYLKRALGKGKVVDTRTPMPETVRRLLRDLEEQQSRLETQVLWNLRQRYPNAQDWLDLLGFGLTDSNRRFEIMEEILSRYFPQTRLLAYRLLHRLRNLAYPDRFQEADKYHKQQAILMLAQRLGRSQIALQIQRDPGQGLLEKRDWDQDGSQEMVISSERQELVVRPENGGIIYHQFVHPEVPMGSVELTYWIENRLKYGSGMDFTGYGALASDELNGWGAGFVCFQLGEDASPSVPAVIPKLEIENLAIEGGGLEVRVSRREIHETGAGEVAVDIEQTYRLLDTVLEYRALARVTPDSCQVFLGIKQPAASDTNHGGGRIQYTAHGSPSFSQGNTSLYQISPGEGADAGFTVRCEF